MRFIEALSYSGADYLMKQKGENHDKRRIYYYGFQIVIGAVVKFLILFILALVTGTILPSFLMAIVFASLRMLAGGYHMDTYGRCLAISITMFIGFALIARYTYSYWNAYYITVFTIVIIALSAFSLYKWAPSDNPNRPITELSEIKKFKRLSIIYLIIWTIAATILIWSNLYLILLSITFGLSLEVFSITPFGHRFFDGIKNNLDKVKK
ncbi:accessory gene regulator ArgB-like protein [Acetivibrio cellulolyticus]|uniref:accessory gene regulator ArgB-like protein n=1 Tax=Acetivibrio cellulolyticus TaxID=35830 RepID=UPI0001E2F15C|nr:accessory gene regulator B family protein [Acetivibrio cellulolyticus]